ncbi:hypothetical protein ACFXAF_30185 [Kitasatospora sp. NPDC059463]|uniref:hypothetical protein n=1 Tax=Kitasatospora sp. NPDC059463 TaxID=3346842 RepID=UPI003694AF5E
MGSHTTEYSATASAVCTVVPTSSSPSESAAGSTGTDPGTRAAASSARPAPPGSTNRIVRSRCSSRRSARSPASISARTRRSRLDRP